MGYLGRSVRVLIVLAAVAVSAGPDRSASAGEAQPRSLPSREITNRSGKAPGSPAPRLRLVWIDILGSAPHVFANASREASAILADAGVETAWTLGDASTVSGGDELKVVLMAGAANGASLPDHVMGGTRRGAQSHATWIYLSNVLWALGFHDRDVGRLSAQEEHQLARALGRVAAHEIVHAVAPELPHTRSGLMAGNLSRRFLIQARVGLAPPERAALRAGAEGFTAAAEPAAAPVALAAAGR